MVSLGLGERLVELGGHVLRLRVASATIVRVGFAAAPVVKTLPSEMNRFGTSWARPKRSTTPSRGRWLMRQVPRLCVDG